MSAPQTESAEQKMIRRYNAAQSAVNAASSSVADLGEAIAAFIAGRQIIEKKSQEMVSEGAKPPVKAKVPSTRSR